MNFTFHGLDGRAAATHAALTTGFALAISGRPAIVLRIAGPNDGVARLPRTMPEGLSFVERTALEGAFSLDELDDMLGEVDPQACDIVLDLPLELVVDPNLSALADLSILAVGPSALDERLAASALGRLATESLRQPLWLLGCGRSGGGPDARRFERSMRSLLGCAGGQQSPRHSFLPVTLPAPLRSETDALGEGRPQSRTVRQGLLLLAAIEVAASDPHAVDLDQNALVEALGLGERTLVSTDQRRLCERLRDLADDLERLEDGGPAPEELDEAPSILSWSFQAGRTRVIAGHVVDHPTIPSGRAALTSDVYATDGKSWARTLSRLYRLDTPAVVMSRPDLQ